MKVQLSVVQGRSPPRALTLDAANADEARERARAMGYTVLAARATEMGIGERFAVGRPARRLDVPVFVEQLRDLLTSGLSVIEALEALRRGARGSSVLAIEALVRQLREGLTLSSAFAADSNFPELLVALVQASELTSDLPQSLTRYLEHEQRATEVRHRLVSASIYPVLLIGVGGLVLLFLLFFVMPRFARVFEGMTGDLPWSARAMMFWASNLHAHGAWWIGAGLIAAIAVAAVAATPRFRTSALQRVLAMPALSERLNTYFLARWYRATGMLVRGGIPLPQALRIANNLLPPAMQAKGTSVEDGVRSGLSPSAAHTKAGMSTPVAEQLMLAGERTGDLGTVLTRIAHYHESEVSRSLERAMRALEPIVMVFIGLGVGIVVVLMYLPIFELASAIQ
jgi:general secretion pathway protein F